MGVPDAVSPTYPSRSWFPGRPPAFWSEEDTNNEGSRNTPADRRFTWSVGPFSMNAGETQDVAFAIVWAQDENRYAPLDKVLASVPRVKQAYQDGLPETTFPAPTDRPTLLSPDENVGSQPSRLTFYWEDVPFAD